MTKNIRKYEQIGKTFLIVLGLNSFVWADYSRDDVHGIVTDSNTTLQWQDNETVAKNWESAINYCETLDLNGAGWRLPNINELFSILDRRVYPAIDPVFQNTSTSYHYWTSTDGVSSVGTAWGVRFAYGRDAMRDKGNDESFLPIRCVRGGK